MGNICDFNGSVEPGSDIFKLRTLSKIVELDRKIPSPPKFQSYGTAGFRTEGMLM
jgi:hypothetical protein